jgi:hypothetical protein
MSQLSELIDGTYAALTDDFALERSLSESSDDYECGKKIYYSVVPEMEVLRKYISTAMKRLHPGVSTSFRCMKICCSACNMVPSMQADNI